MVAATQMNEVDIRALDGPQFATAYLNTIDALPQFGKVDRSATPPQM
jgi:hypothetical protein